jgi:hypothetical protein
MSTHSYCHIWSTKQPVWYSHDKELKCTETKVCYYIMFALCFSKVDQLLFKVSILLSRTISKLYGLGCLVSTEIRLQVGLPLKWGSILSRNGDISLCHYVQHASGSHSASNYMDNRGYSLGVQQIRNQANNSFYLVLKGKPLAPKDNIPQCAVWCQENRNSPIDVSRKHTK